MSGFIEGENRYQSTMFPERLDDYVGEDSATRVIDVFIDRLDLSGLGFKTEPADTGRPAYHASTMLKIYVYGYLNRVQSSRRLAREAGRNVELMWLVGRLAPDFKTIADFRKNFKGEEILACDESGFTTYLPRPQTSSSRKRGLFSKRDFIYRAEDNEYECPAGERLIWRFSTEEKGQTIHKNWSSNCHRCAIRGQCTSGQYRRIGRWEHEAVVEAVEARLEKEPERMRVRRETVEHPFGTLKCWMGYTHFQTKTLKRVSTKMSLHVLAYNLKRVVNIMGILPLIEAIEA
jgi:transposase